jgi:hypothetical protein
LGKVFLQLGGGSLLRLIQPAYTLRGLDVFCPTVSLLQQRQMPLKPERELPKKGIALRPILGCKFMKPACAQIHFLTVHLHHI